MRYILILALLLGIGIPSCGQNNPYGINDECYRLFLLANQNQANRIGLVYADSIIAIGQANNDAKAVCIGRSAVLNCKRSGGTTNEMSEAAQNLRNEAEKSGYSQYLYYAYNIEINELLDNGHRNRALKLADECYKKATEKDDHYGIYISHLNSMEINYARNDIAGARREARKAINYFLSNKDLVDTKTVSSTFCVLASTYTTERNDSCRYYLGQALDYSKTQEDTIMTYSFYARRCAVEHNKEEFDKYYELLQGYDYHSRNETNARILAVYNEIFNGDLAEAERIANTIGPEEDRLKSLQRIAIEREDYQASLRYSDSIIQFLIDSKHAEADLELAEYTANFNNERIRMMEQQKRGMLLGVIVVLFLMLVIGAAGATFYVLNERRKHEKRIAQVKDVFVQNMSHDIRTPLNSVMGFAQLLSMPGMQWTEEEREEFGKIIMSNGKILTMLIDDILNMSNVETGNYSKHIQPENVSEICHTVLKIVEYRVPAGVKLEYKSELPADYMLNTDNGRLQQILINFLTNACKHTVRGSITLSCSLKENPGFLSFAVTDTGSGVPADQSTAIFDRFTKLDAMKPGTGLGLSICKTLSEKMNGRVYLDTTYTEGARFVFAHSILLDPTPLFSPEQKTK